MDEMSITRKLIASAMTAAAFVAAPAAVSMIAPQSSHVVVADPVGSGGGDAGGGGACGSGDNWNGCGGWNPFQGGFGSGCVNGICVGWDGSRGWGNF